MGSLGDGLVCAAPQRGEGERLLEAGTRGAAPPTPNLPGDTLTCDHEGGDLLLKTGHMDVTVPLTRLRVRAEPQWKEYTEDSGDRTDKFCRGVAAQSIDKWGGDPRTGAWGQGSLLLV